MIDRRPEEKYRSSSNVAGEVSGLFAKEAAHGWPANGTVTFLFTDIEGSTTLLQRLGDRRCAEALAEHQRLLRDGFIKGNGQEIDTQGDASLVAFSRARDAVVAAQRALTKHAWPDGASLRAGLHTGEPVSETGDHQDFF